MAIVAKWNLNGNANDSSGNGYNGTPANISYFAGKDGQSASFNGSSSQIYGFSGDITVGKSFTASCVFKCLSLPSGGNAQSIFFDYKSNSFPAYGNGGFGFQVQDSSGAKARYTLSDSTGETNVLGTTTITAGLWYYLVLTYNGTIINCYINGKLDNSANSTKDFGTSTTANNRRRIGALDYGSTIQWFNGLVDECILYDNGQSVAEIKNKCAYYNGFF